MPHPLLVVGSFAGAGAFLAGTGAQLWRRALQRALDASVTRATKELSVPAVPTSGLRAALDGEAGELRTELAQALAPDRAGVRATLEGAWAGFVREALVGALIEADVDVLAPVLDQPGPRRALAAAVRSVATRPGELAGLREALLQLLAHVPAAAVLPRSSDPAMRTEALRRVYEEVVAPELVRFLVEADVRPALQVDELLRTLEDERVRRALAACLRGLARDADRLRRLHGAVIEAYGDERLLAVGPFELSAADVARRFVTVTEVQSRLTRTATRLERAFDPRGRPVRAATLEFLRGWLDAWRALPEVQRRGAAQAAEERLAPLFFPLVTALVDDVLARLRLDAAARALVDDAWLADRAVALATWLEDDEASAHARASTLAIAAAAREAWRAQPASVRRPLVEALVDALAPTLLDRLAAELHARRETLARAWFTTQAPEFTALLGVLDRHPPFPKADPGAALSLVRHEVEGRAGGLVGTTILAGALAGGALGLAALAALR